MWKRFIPWNISSWPSESIVPTTALVCQQNRQVRLTTTRTNIHLVLARILVISTVIIHQVDEFQLVAHTTLEIVGIVCGGDLDGTGTERHVDSDGIGNDGYAAAKEGVNGKFAVKVLVSLVVWVNGNGSVTEHGFGTGGGNDDALVYTVSLR
jgi:hypothetical protein